MAKLIERLKGSSDTLRFLAIALALMIVTLAVGVFLSFFNISLGLGFIVLGSLAAGSYGLAALIIFLGSDDGNI